MKTVLVTGLIGSGKALAPMGVLAGLLSGVGYALYSIFGKYAVNKSDREKGICRQALCSYKLIFTKESGVLGYLAGKTVEIPRDKISFAAM